MIAHAVAWTLVHFVWQGALVAGALALVLAGARRASPQARYAAACGALAAMVIAPVATFAFAFSRLGGARAVAAAAPAHAAPVSTWVTLAWALGASAMLVRLAGGHAHARRLVSGAVPLAALEAEARRLGRALGLDRLVRVGESAAVAVPTVVGWLRPVVLLPLSLASQLPPRAIEALLLHELAHVRRHDYLVNAVQHAVEALLFFHPCVYWVSRVLREEREHCCDDLAAAAHGDPLSYARALTMAEVARGDAPALGLASNGGSLMKRVQRLLTSNAGTARAVAWPAPAFAAAVLLAVASVPAVACSDTTQSETGSAALAQSAGALLPQSVTRWMPELRQAGARWGVDPDLLAAITLLESRGDPDAVSPGGSIGLMQIMPATGAKIAEERGLADYSAARLRDPSYNVDLGAWYLAQQMRDFGQVELAAAAYNAGPKAVRAYLDHGAPLPEETRQYEARVAELWHELRASKQGL